MRGFHGIILAKFSHKMMLLQDNLAMLSVIYLPKRVWAALLFEWLEIKGIIRFEFSLKRSDRFFLTESIYPLPNFYLSDKQCGSCGSKFNLIQWSIDRKLKVNRVYLSVNDFLNFFLEPP